MHDAPGSGFVPDRSGLIATNNHVVADATNIVVTFSTGQQQPATPVGTDSANDLALIPIMGLPASARPVTLGDSENVTVGETASDGSAVTDYDSLASQITGKQPGVHAMLRASVALSCYRR